MNQIRYFLLITFVVMIAAFATTAVAGPRSEAQPLKFSGACEPGDSLNISAVGDFLFHSNLQQQAARLQNRYISIWEQILPLFQRADVRYGNLEGPVAPGVLKDGSVTTDPGTKYDGNVYSGYPRFNYPSAVAEDLKASGITIVSTANNHAMDRTSRGANLTIENLDRVGVKYVGTRKTSDAEKWYEVVQDKGFNTAWVACSFSTNGLPDKQGQVLGCFSDTDKLLNLVSQLSKSYDAVFVTPHWGDEYQLQPNSRQTALGRRLLEAGALAVIGTHPHVLQPWQKIVTADGKERFIIYSTGNFASGQVGVAKRTSILVYLTLGRNASKGTFIRGVGYVPLVMDAERGRGSYVRPLNNENDQAPNESWSIWYGHYGRANRVYSTDADLSSKFCNLQ